MNVPGANVDDCMDAIERSFDEMMATFPVEIRSLIDGSELRRMAYLSLFSQGFASGMKHGRDLTLRQIEFLIGDTP